MSSHPGSTLNEAIALAEYLRDLGYMPEQVQDFYPTPSTISTVMYYTGLDPRTMKEVYTPTNPHEKAMQRALIQYRNPKNYYLVREALQKADREDLIGFDKKCLIRPYPPGHAPGNYSTARPNPNGKPAAKNGRPADHHKKDDRRSTSKREDRRGASSRDQKPQNSRNGRPAPSGRPGKPQASSRSGKPKNNRRGK